MPCICMGLMATAVARCRASRVCSYNPNPRQDNGQSLARDHPTRAPARWMRPNFLWLHDAILEISSRRCYPQLATIAQTHMHRHNPVPHAVYAMFGHTPPMTCLDREEC